MGPKAKRERVVKPRLTASCRGRLEDPARAVEIRMSYCLTEDNMIGNWKQMQRCFMFHQASRWRRTNEESWNFKSRRRLHVSPTTITFSSPQLISLHKRQRQCLRSATDGYTCGHIMPWEGWLSHNAEIPWVERECPQEKLVLRLRVIRIMYCLSAVGPESTWVAHTS